MTGPGENPVTAPVDLDALAARLELPDAAARTAAEERQSRLTKPAGAWLFAAFRDLKREPDRMP